MSDNPLDGCFDVAPRTTALTMSSREIAELCKKRHDNVMSDIRNMLEELGLHAPDFSGAYKTGRGNQYECFHLPKRETLILVSGYKLVLRAAIIDRWQELEEQVATRKLPATSREVTVADFDHDALAKIGSVVKNVVRKRDTEMIGGIEAAIDQMIFSSVRNGLPRLEKYVEQIVEETLQDFVMNQAAPLAEKLATIVAKRLNEPLVLEPMATYRTPQPQARPEREPPVLPRMDLRLFRKMRGWSMDKMGAAVGVRGSCVWKHEHSYTIPSPRTMAMYAKVSRGMVTTESFYDAYRAKWGDTKPRARR